MLPLALPQPDFGGQILPPTPGTGTYAVNPSDCTGTMTINISGGVSINRSLVVVDGGNRGIPKANKTHPGWHRIGGGVWPGFIPSHRTNGVSSKGSRKW